MALKLLINISKMIPGPHEYSSIQASCSLEGDCSAGQDPVAEAQRLYGLAQQAVDAQLGITTRPTQPQATPTASSQPRPSTYTSRSTTQPAPPSRARRPAPVTDSQLRLIDRLLRESNTDPAAILRHHNVQAFGDLSCKQASQVIDDLKQLAGPQ